MRKLLSYPMDEMSPGWPGNPKVKIKAYTNMSEGDVNNHFEVKFFNHFGSHMDGPKHFNNDGARIAELPVETFFYDRPLLIDLPKSYGELVTREDLEPYAEKMKDADLLMIRSGFSDKRKSDPEGYAGNGPGFTGDSCKYLMDEFPNLKGVAMDWISLASYTNIDEGILAHQYLLGMFHDDYMVIIEDLNFASLTNDTLESVIALPLLINGIDSAPCTVVAEIKS